MAPQQSAASDYFKQFLNTALNVWKKPVTAGKEYVMSGKFTLAIGYLLVQAVLAVILGMVFEARSSLANLAEFAGSSVGVTYVKVFFGTLFLSAIFRIWKSLDLERLQAAISSAYFVCHVSVVFDRLNLFF